MRSVLLISLAVLSLSVGWLVSACDISPIADSEAGAVCEPNTALDCVGDNNCKGGALCLGGTGYGSCQCLDDAGALVLPDGAVIYPHPADLSDAGGLGTPDATDEPIDFPDVGFGPPPGDGGGTPIATTCDNSERVAPPP
jgi:hypothetical protein